MKRVVVVLVAFLAAVLVSAAVGSVAKAPALYKNCTNLDKTSGVPVKNFYRSNRVYAIAIKWNAGLDRDHDRIACETQ
jgi:hypothetical protein